jgi:predicted RNA polymerase sigma factor
MAPGPDLGGLRAHHRHFLSRAQVGLFQIQAAIAAVHAEASQAQDTDWPQIFALYDLLAQSSTNPVVLLNRAVSVAMVHGPQAGLDLLAELDADRSMSVHHRLHAVRGHLLERAGDRAAARAAFEEATRLQAQAVRLANHGPAEN